MNIDPEGAGWRIIWRDDYPRSPLVVCGIPLSEEPVIRYLFWITPGLTDWCTDENSQKLPPERMPVLSAGGLGSSSAVWMKPRGAWNARPLSLKNECDFTEEHPAKKPSGRGWKWYCGQWVKK